MLEYLCPRCYYVTKYKGDMKRHLYRLKTPCYSSKNNIVMTDEIKEHVLKHRRYDQVDSVNGLDTTGHAIIPDKMVANVTGSKEVIVGTVIQNNNQTINVQNITNVKPNNSVKNIVNNYKFIQNIVVKMDPITKVNHILEYQNESLTGYEPYLERLFMDRLCKMDDPNNNLNHSLSRENIIECVNEATRLNGSTSNFNVFYQRDTKRIKIYHEETWTTYLEDSGVSKIIDFLRLNYLNDYELYLLRKLHDTSPNRKVWNSERLETYYRLLFTYDMLPYVEGLTDKFIIGKTIKPNNDHSIEDYAFGVYNIVKREMKLNEKKDLKRTILNVIKSNTVENLKEINLTLTNLLHMDYEYKDKILPKLLNGIQVDQEGHQLTIDE